MGNMTGDCTTVGLTEHLTMIKASGNPSNGVEAIKFKESENHYKIGQLYGDVGEDKILWDFSDNIMPVGVWGETTERGIEKLGFVTVNRECQAAIVNEDQFIDVDTLTFEQGEGNAESSEEEDARNSPAFMWVIIGAGSVVFMTILIITVCAFKRTIKTKSDQIDDEATAVSRRNNKADEENKVTVGF